MNNLNQEKRKSWISIIKFKFFEFILDRIVSIPKKEVSKVLSITNITPLSIFSGDHVKQIQFKNRLERCKDQLTLLLTNQSRQNIRQTLVNIEQYTTSDIYDITGSPEFKSASNLILYLKGFNDNPIKGTEYVNLIMFEVNHGLFDKVSIPGSKDPYSKLKLMFKLELYNSLNKVKIQVDYKDKNRFILDPISYTLIQSFFNKPEVTLEQKLQIIYKLPGFAGIYKVELLEK